MKKGAKPVFFIVTALILIVAYLAFFGIHTMNGDYAVTYIKGGNDIRWGIDIRGGVDVTFAPPEGIDATDGQMASAKAVIEQRLLNLNITDSEVYLDNSRDRIIVRFPWKEDETTFDPEAAIAELGATAELTFREGYSVDENGLPTGNTENIILTGANVIKAEVLVNSETNLPVVSLKLDEEGAQNFYEATKKLSSESNGRISIWMDDVAISAPGVSSAIEGGEAIIESSSFTAEEATSLANKINAGALPFKLTTDNYSTLSPTLGTGARDAMVLAGIIAFILIAVYLILLYRLPGLVAVIALLGQLACTVAAISGFFPNISSFTLTLPGIAGIVLAIGMGVDANIITFSRIKEELSNGKTLDGALDAGFHRGFTDIFDGNLTIIIVSVVLMGAFGPPNSFFSTLLTPFFFMFGPTTAGTVYSFGYTLLIGVILNFVFGILASRLMLRSLSRFKCLRKPWLFGGKKA